MTLKLDRQPQKVKGRRVTLNENWLLPLLNGLVMLAFVILASWLSWARAETLPVIYDSGTARPLSDFIKAPNLTPPPALPEATLAESDGFAEKLFPIHTPELSPGEVMATSTQLFLPQPLFIIGCDARSRKWLSQFSGRLQQIGAVGLVVEAETLADYQAMVAIATGIRLSPTPASQLAQQLALRHYPVLISASRIEQ
jgi:integrating conjugative element protein (TIGR03765 family)